MQWYVDVILPLPLADSFTYRLEEFSAPIVQVGSRVVVQFGVKRYYTALVVRKHTDVPKGDYEIKPIVEVLDSHPIVQPRQLELWQWIADYYMCSVGDVYKAALPSGLKLESETVVELNADFVPEIPLREKEQKILDALSLRPKQRVQQLLKSCGLKQGMHAIRTLLDKGAIYVDEAIQRRYKPKSEIHVRLCEAYRTEESLSEVLLVLKRAPKQQQLLFTLLDLIGGCFPDTLCKGMSRSTLLKVSGMSSSVLMGLLEKGVVETYAVENNRLIDALGEPSCEMSSLSSHQQAAYDETHSVWQSHDVCLLHGVTSSGKTEVYIHLINEQLQQGKQVLYLLPEIALTRQMTERLRRAFGNRMGVYHSKFSDAERVEVWQKQLSETPFDVILGVRSSVFLPFRNLGLVIVDEEHESTYKQQDPAPRYHARSVAVMLVSRFGGKVLLGTATPSIESYYNAQCGKYGLVQLTQRYSQVQLPHIEVVDLKDEYRRKRMYGPFSTFLHDAMRDALNQGRQVILFQNRRGYAPMLECVACGWVPRCDRCDVSLTYHQGQQRLVCHYCGNVYSVPVQCPSCGTRSLAKHGMGTERIEEEVHRYFPTARVARLDLDTTRSKTASGQIIRDFQEGKTDVLIGTQMVSKGLDFDKVHVVGIINADTMLNLPDFRSYERSFQLMAQVAGRAGRRGEQGLVVLQTKNVELPVIRQVVNNDYSSLYADQAAERDYFRYPPYCRLIYLYVKGRDELSVVRASDAIGQGLRSYFGERVLGPESPSVARVQGLFIRKLMLKTETSLGISRVRQCIYAVEQNVAQSGLLSGITVYYDVDPM